MIKVSSGFLKGREIKTSPTFEQRPTLGRIRGSIFDLLRSRIDFPDFTFFDFFAGSGAVGIEAVSQGFKKTILVEKDLANYKAILKNVRDLNIAPEKIDVVHSDVFNWFSKQVELRDPSIFFIDPPYQSGAYLQALEQISFLLKRTSFNMLAYVVIEKGAKVSFDFSLQNILTRKKYGGTEIILTQIS